MTTPTLKPDDPIQEDVAALARLCRRGYLTIAQLSSIRAKMIKAVERSTADALRREAARFVDEVTSQEEPEP